jgi:hypothetical protein
MDTDLKKFYDDARDMFQTPGWRNFIEDLANAYLGLNDIASVRNAEDLFYRQGQGNIINYVLGYEESLAAAEEEAEAEQKAEDEEHG